MPRDLLLNPPPPDPTRLAQAEAHYAELIKYPDQGPQQNAPSLRALGENLFNIAAPETAQTHAVLTELQWVAADTDARLRVWLDVPEYPLAGLPWEYLCVPESVLAATGLDPKGLGWSVTLNEDAPLPFLALHPHVSLVRGSGPRQAWTPAERIGALKVLVAWADPDCTHWGRVVGVETEIEGIRQATRGLPSSCLQLEVLPHATKETLRERLADFRPHVLHIASHGGFPVLDDPGDLLAPSLVLESAPGAGSCHTYLTANELAHTCVEASVRAVVLNASWSAASSHTQARLASALSRAVCVARSGDAQPRTSDCCRWLRRAFLLRSDGGASFRGCGADLPEGMCWEPLGLNGAGVGHPEPVPRGG